LLSEQDRPNVVFILTDDQGPWAAGFSGNGEIRTPNLDALAAGGVRFENFFCTSPVCSPARASLMTGRIPSAHGVHDWINERDTPPEKRQAYLAGQRCYTDILTEAGYDVGLSGKWHLGDSSTLQHGFGHWFAMPYGSSQYNNAEMYRDGRLQVCQGYLTDVITDDAIGFIETRADSERPFYLALHYNAPHSPWFGHPQDIVDSYDRCPFATCPQEPAHPWVNPALAKCLGDREKLKGYFAAVTAMDAAVGRFLARLDALGLRNSTLVVFTSDNGFSCGHHGFWGKGNGTYPLNMYENSVKVPFVIAGRGIPAGRTSAALVSQYDLMHTLLDYLGLPAANDPTLPGTSFLPAVMGQADQVRDDVVVYDEYGPVRMIRTQEWKYVHRYPDGPHELYDLKHDPAERKNLVDEKKCRPIVEEMWRRLTDWFARYVRPELDGSRLPVTGSGQRWRIDEEHSGQDAFVPPREELLG